MEGGKEISLSIEETNKLRISLGLKPLVIGTSNQDSKARDNYENYKNAQQEHDRVAQLKKKIDSARNKRMAQKKLQGATLADNDGEDDTMSWIQRSREREKELAARRAKELEDQERELALAAKRQATTEGLKIRHDLDLLMEQAGDEDEFGHGQVLVLKDSTIEENEKEGDELFSLAVHEKEKRKKDEEKRKKYNPMDYEANQKGVLHQYDEDEDKVFTIGDAGGIRVEKKEDTEMMEVQGHKVVNMAYEKMKEIQDYYTKEEEEEAHTTFKKSKKKKEKRAGKVTRFDDDEVLNYTNANQDTSNVNFVDDDDLQSALSRARNIARKKAKEEEPDQGLSKLLKRGEELEAQVKVEDEGLVLSSTAEFVRSLPTIEDFIKEEKEEKVERLKVEKVETIQHVEDKVEEMELDEPKPDEKPLSEDEAPINEPLVGKGLAATLSLLKGRGEIEFTDPEQKAREAALLEQMKWRKEQKLAEARREREKQAIKERRRQEEAKATNRGQRVLLEEERLREEEEEDRRRAREMEERFKDYKPEVKLEYTDEFGRSVGPKEAFKMLSYQFHGMSSGKAKTEKKLKKMEEELKQKASNSLNTTSKMEDVTKRLGQAHVVLQVGGGANAKLLQSLKREDGQTGTASTSSTSTRKRKEPES